MAGMARSAVRTPASCLQIHKYPLNVSPGQVVKSCIRVFSREFAVGPTFCYF